jgi:UDP-N-acetylmuramoyl-tripeptide--D-alanyl-D-alanine ligase
MSHEIEDKLYEYILWGVIIMHLTITEINEAVKGTIKNSVATAITSVEFDSRKIKAGALFVPLAGVHDGHEFVEAAIKNGAVAVFWSRQDLPAPQTITVIEVKDTLKAMQNVAVHYLNQVGAKVIGITGSNGKTTTKDMTAAVLSEKFHTYKTQGNFNNNIGMPYTMLQMPQDTERLVLEMGMDRAGEITELSQMAHPEVAAITIVGEAHIEYLGSRAGIARAKMEIIAGLKSDGLLIVPENEPLLKPLTDHLTQTVKAFGLDEGVIAGDVVSSDKDETTFTIGAETFTIPVPGSYNVTNALIAYGIGRWYGLSIAEIKHGLAHFQLTQNRTEWLKAVNGADLMSDVYNANPTAMGLVLDTFGTLPTNGGKRYAVLADMLELGPDSGKMHAGMSEHLTRENFAKVFLYGPEMKHLASALAKKGVDYEYFTTAEKPALIEAVKKSLQANDMLVLKGSNSMKLREVVDALV